MMNPGNAQLWLTFGFPLSRTMCLGYSRGFLLPQTGRVPAVGISVSSCFQWLARCKVCFTQRFLLHCMHRKCNEKIHSGCLTTPKLSHSNLFSVRSINTEGTDTSTTNEIYRYILDFFKKVGIFCSLNNNIFCCILKFTFNYQCKEFNTRFSSDGRLL